MNEKLYIYLDKTSGAIIAIKGKKRPTRSARMKVVYEWCVEEQKFIMANFPEIPNNLLFSNRFIWVGTLTKDLIY